VTGQWELKAGLTSCQSADKLTARASQDRDKTCRPDARGRHCRSRRCQHVGGRIRHPSGNSTHRSGRSFGGGGAGRPDAATVISLPRYLWVAIPAPSRGTVQGKLYSAFAIGAAQDASFLASRWRTPTGAGDLEAATVEGAIGQHVDAWIALDEGAFAAIVDSLGGLSVTVPEPLDDWQYPVDDTERTMHVHFNAGPQLMDGERALEYSRSRLSTSEADRSKRQELVLVAMMRKMRGFRPGLRVAATIGPLESGLRTNLLPVDFRALTALGSQLDPGSVKRVTLEDSGLLREDTIGTSNIVVPTSGDYEELQRYVAEQLP
jgi:LCP family protein required for cell wall assembly